MTRLALLDHDQAHAILQTSLEAEPAQETAIAELIRDEVSARGACQRAMTVRRVCRLAAPVISLEAERVGDLCCQLEREGDLVIADEGLLMATPLRAIDLGQGRFRLASSLATRRLKTLLSGSWGRVGIARICQVEDPIQLHAQVDAVGGRVLTPGEWAGLKRVPAADQDWLDGLDRRLQASPEVAGSLERDEPLAWSACQITAAGLRWLAAPPTSGSCLWRARTRFGYWRHAWSQEGPPSTAPFVTLGADEGSRTTFALARVASLPLTGVITQDDHQAILAIRHWLPRAEYRFLAVHATAREADRGGSRWSLPSEQLAEVTAMLAARLGLVMVKGMAA